MSEKPRDDTCARLSEPALSDWLRPEEDAAWEWLMNEDEADHAHDCRETVPTVSEMRLDWMQERRGFSAEFMAGRAAGFYSVRIADPLSAAPEEWITAEYDPGCRLGPVLWMPEGRDAHGVRVIEIGGYLHA